jgi:hypothetical protein
MRFKEDVAKSGKRIVEPQKNKWKCKTYYINQIFDIIINGEDLKNNQNIFLPLKGRQPYPLPIVIGTDGRGVNTRRPLNPSLTMRHTFRLNVN